MLSKVRVVFVLLSAALFVGLWPGAAQAQCDNPKTSEQRAQCVGDELRGADRTINRVYGDLMKSLSPEDRMTLRDEQRAWIKNRDLTCGLTWSKGDREAWLTDLLRDYQKTVCVVRLTNDRVQALYNYQKANAVAPAAAPSAPSDSTPLYDLFTREPKTSGKWYFEVKVDEPAIQKLAEATFSAGVFQAVAAAGASNERGGSYGSLITVRRVDKVVEIYTLGFAVDLDNGKLYISKNGSWFVGVPGSSGGIDLLRGRAYKGQFSSSVSIYPFLNARTLDVNFGERAFAYHLPDGYSPLQPH
ncbi:MAG TPA: lysozyme inhibitor LprI family protein [Candidatus Sulfotelmatobacter sp.]|nr:lysozyme inhibitor LprI family protein [Candidatus Sulfotelmatobacter sp.]